jgi:hypothetical protein
LHEAIGSLVVFEQLLDIAEGLPQGALDAPPHHKPVDETSQARARLVGDDQSILEASWNRFEMTLVSCIG